MAKIIIIFSMTALLLAGGCGSPGPENILLEESMQNDGPPPADRRRGILRPRSPAHKAHVLPVPEPGPLPASLPEPNLSQTNSSPETDFPRKHSRSELAGGLLEQAEADKINQAECLKDGQMIYIPVAGEEEPEDSFGESRNEDGRVNLNTATEAELMALPGIGAAKAGSILDWREKNGGFGQIEDLMKVEGIKDGVFAKIKDSVKVD